MDFFSLQGSNATQPDSTQTSSLTSCAESSTMMTSTNNNNTAKRISTLSFDPTKIRKSFLQNSEPEPAKVFEEEFSKEGLLCQLCGETFHTRVSLEVHMKRHAVKEEHPYSEENTSALGEVVPVEQRRVYRPREKKYECSICNKRFNTKYSIRCHMKIHAGDTPFQCPMCEKRFAHGRNLHRHITVAHKGHEATAASLCAKLIQETNSHENRMVVYTGELPKPYKCAVCEKTFKRLYRVKEHTRSHTGQKPFQCSVCSKLFSSSDILYRHIKRLHSSVSNQPKPKIEEPPAQPEFGNNTTIIQIDDGSGSTYSIPVQQSANELTFLHDPQRAEVITVNGVLDSSFNNNAATYYIDLRSSELTPAEHLEVHEEVESEPPLNNSPEKAFQCSLCGEAFDSGPLLNKHIDTHKLQLPAKCHICTKVFKAESYLKRHMIIHSGEKPFKCSLCPKAFNRQYRLNNHWRTHTGERPYICSVCNKSFAVSDNMYRHIKKIHKGVGLEFAAGLVKQLQDVNREKKYSLLYGDISPVDPEESLN